MNCINESDMQAFIQKYSGVNKINSDGSKVLFRLFVVIAVLSPLGLIPMFLDSDPKRFLVLILVGIIALLALSIRMGVNRVQKFSLEDQQIVFLPVGYQIKHEEILSIRVTKHKRTDSVRIALVVRNSNFKYFAGCFYWIGQSVTFNV